MRSNRRRDKLRRSRRRLRRARPGRVASSTAASQCTTLPLDPTDYYSDRAEEENQRSGGRRRRGTPADSGLEALCSKAGPSVDTLMELQR